MDELDKVKPLTPSTFLQGIPNNEVLDLNALDEIASSQGDEYEDD
jgi:hypothetical protein